MRISIGPIRGPIRGPILAAALTAALAACAPIYPEPPPGLEPGLPLAWKDFTGTRRGDAQMAQARDACILEGDRWAGDRAERTMTPAAQMSGYAPAMMAAIDEGRRAHILRCMRFAGWEPA
ncbi:hypothetical protein [Roseococcus sp. SYP-B2431]|uniref:hypothetical protein n=1 Tax=Roseococcus sp. SYP-B2431 TaxID=2496640 RepID=UPI0013F49EEE|nr:hypothetical protein [Roseococcus sp. SYP-B2431]